MASFSNLFTDRISSFSKHAAVIAAYGVVKGADPRTQVNITGGSIAVAANTLGDVTAEYLMSANSKGEFSPRFVVMKCELSKLLSGIFAGLFAMLIKQQKGLGSFSQFSDAVVTSVIASTIYHQAVLMSAKEESGADPTGAPSGGN